MAVAGPSRIPTIRNGCFTITARNSDGYEDLFGSDEEQPWSIDEEEEDLGITRLLNDIEDQNVNQADDGNQQSIGEDDSAPLDAIAALTNAVERRLELVPAGPPLPNTSDSSTHAFGRRLTSTISNIWSKSKSRFLTRTVRECIACTDPIIGKTIRVPCGHYYDTECIVSLFEAASKDESLFPPRCCKRFISFQSVRAHFPDSVRDTFLQKSREFSTAKRVYCARPQCSRFLGPQLDAKRSRLKAYSCGCGTTTCCHCKQAHGGRDGTMHACVEVVDEETQVMLALGKERGWPRCPGCRTMIELNLGCYHMTCVCKVEFCYLCEARWKTCTCPQWD